jgi:hypothetical protein
MLAKKSKIVPINSGSECPKNSGSETIQVEPAVCTKSESKLTFKVSPKKGVSVYGLQRFPVTLYKDQWLTLISNIDVLKEFISVHDKELAEKQQDETV